MIGCTTLHKISADVRESQQRLSGLVYLTYCPTLDLTNMNVYFKNTKRLFNTTPYYWKNYESIRFLKIYFQVTVFKPN